MKWLITFGTLGLLLGYLWICTYILYTTSYDELILSSTMKSWGNIYKEVNLYSKASTQAKKMVYPMFLTERILYFITPFALRKQAFFFRVLCLVYLKIIMMGLHLHINPFDAPPGIRVVKNLADWTHLLMYTLMTCFTNLV
jgi:hypothetical protein